MNKELMFILNTINQKLYMYECGSYKIVKRRVCIGAYIACSCCLLNKNDSPNMYKNQILRMKL